MHLSLNFFRNGYTIKVLLFYFIDSLEIFTFIYILALVSILKLPFLPFLIKGKNKTARDKHNCNERLIHLGIIELALHKNEILI